MCIPIPTAPGASKYFQLALGVLVEELLMLAEDGVVVRAQKQDGSYELIRVFVYLLSSMCDLKADPKLSMRFQYPSLYGTLPTLPSRIITIIQRPPIVVYIVPVW